ncbi:regulatory protein RecX [Pseudoclavibacter sp. 13-3]|uniref:regulatory protein RecX n=1 Tax=Pseudoclavibacter sp. 13-3 TaxID=2901228 RepID=UPI001E4F5DED|nr:RecX family transcriptional regulator [Pseudoclavibacter sp. 13-3]MCD7100970.1 RecX family transcriptional regulator [Pseudoclavibacter sp. 13-3]
MSDDNVVSLGTWRRDAGEQVEPAATAPEHRQTGAEARVISLAQRHRAAQGHGLAEAPSQASAAATTCNSGHPGDEPAADAALAGATDAATALGEMLGADPELLQARAELDRLLTRRDRTEAELRGALCAHEIAPSAVDAVIAEAQQRGDIDDRQIAQDIAEQILRRRGQGTIVIRRALEERGLDRSVIDDTLAELDDDQQIDQAEALARKRLRSLGAQQPAVQRQRLSATLQRKGFDSETVHLAIARVLG